MRNIPLSKKLLEVNTMRKQTQTNSVRKPFWRRRPFLITLFVLMNVIVIAVTAIAEFGKSKDATEITEVRLDWWFLLPAAICFLVAVTIDIYKYAMMIRKMSPKQNALSRTELFRVARRTVLLGKYYDNITPAAVGGQPFQIYYMRRNSGLAIGLSTSIPIFGMISVQIGFIIIALVCFLFGGLINDNPALIVTALIGLLFYAFWPVMVMGVSFFPKATTRFIKTAVKILAKIHIVKNREETLARVEREVSEYAKSVKIILRTRGLFAKTIIISVVYNLLVASIPFFVLTAFGGNVDFWHSLATTVAVMSAIYFIPTPGNSGAAEGTFFVVFSALSSGYVFWAMLVWRFFSYYIYIILGLITYLNINLEKRRAHDTSRKL